MQQTRLSFFNSQIEQWSRNLSAFLLYNRESFQQDSRKKEMLSQPANRSFPFRRKGPCCFVTNSSPCGPVDFTLIRSLVKGPKWRSKFRIAKPPTVHWGRAKSYGKCIHYFWGTIQGGIFYISWHSTAVFRHYVRAELAKKSSKNWHFQPHS